MVLSVQTKGQEMIWIEAEDFNNLGGWTKDWQFIDQMGSPYLMSIGYGKPVADATTTIRLPKTGHYRLWVRTYDWFNRDHPGRFKISINQQESSVKFGQNGKQDWNWEDGGVFLLRNQVDIKLQDLTGFYGRCDAIILASDTTWTPPKAVAELAAFRIKHGPISQEIKDMEPYDVVVIGGGIAGSLAAVAAAREGSKTVLIQNRGQLGGNASHEILVPPVGSVQTILADEYKIYDPRETGLIEEIATYGGQRYFEDGKQFPVRLQALVEAEPNLDLHLYTHATSVEMQDDQQIGSVIAINVQSNQRMRFSGKLFIDCTGNGIIGVKAGADYRYGKEPKSMYNESKAPEKGDSSTLGSSLKYWYHEHDHPQPFNGPSWAYQLTQCSDFQASRHPRIGPIDNQWTIELGGTDRTYANAEKVRDDLLRLIYGIWDHIKNHCPRLKEEAQNLELVWVGHVVGVRESYRLLGDYLMTEQDVTEQPLLPDRIAYGGWGLDEHPSLGFFEKEQLNDHTHRGVLHSIPYRSLYSRNINNLMMAGRNISVSHVALTGTRVMYTTGVIGQATGLAAGMCIEKNVDPRAIHDMYLGELQQRLLKTGAYIIALPNQDPDDLALLANVQASSEASPAFDAVNGYARATLPTAYQGAEMYRNAWLPAANHPGPHWLQLEWDRPREFNVIHITFQNRGELAPRKIRIEKRTGKAKGDFDSLWEKVLEVNNDQAQRRLLIPLGNVETESLRIVLEDAIERGGITEIRVYQEPDHVIETLHRSNKLMRSEVPEILLPWEKEEKD